ncbi:unnamed protein product [Acanthoscelides obtectus]|uniref:Uncharacterized protein n=1 Tax=Acanthoscelides obtectus TaxID=200917 RepID=A0A9P0JXP4_ACAOB|nr:unnamed protein product [Acanthoscelides obtectus]CAK1631429.1 hypothetical protein AOBTE_LOCUS6949 [Acanthoscelides obtectus]
MGHPVYIYGFSEEFSKGFRSQKADPLKCIVYIDVSRKMQFVLVFAEKRRACS